MPRRNAGSRWPSWRRNSVELLIPRLTYVNERRMSERESRRGPRVETAIPAVMVDSAGDEHPVVVTNLSSGGFRLRGERPMMAGQNVSLRVNRYGAFPATIEWATGNEAGGRFLEPVHLFNDVPV